MNNETYPARILGKGFALLEEELRNVNNGKYSPFDFAIAPLREETIFIHN
jgi:hypothetical protein